MSESRKLGLEEASPLILFAGLLGIPAAGLVALTFAVQIPRFLYGQAAPLFFAAEMGGVISVLFLLLMLRVCLALPSAPGGFYRDVLDFLALARWHPAVKATLFGILVLPPAWYLHGQRGFFMLLRILGRHALRSGDVQSTLDGIAVISQLALTGGIPLLFALHMLSRWKPKLRLLPWLLIPIIFAGTAVGVVLIVTIMH